MLFSFAVTAKLICAFVFAYADCWFSHDAAHLSIFVDFVSDETCLLITCDVTIYAIITC